MKSASDIIKKLIALKEAFPEPRYKQLAREVLSEHKEIEYESVEELRQLYELVGNEGVVGKDWQAYEGLKEKPKGAFTSKGIQSAYQAQIESDPLMRMSRLEGLMNVMIENMNKLVDMFEKFYAMQFLTLKAGGQVKKEGEGEDDERESDDEDEQARKVSVSKEASPVSEERQEGGLWEELTSRQKLVRETQDNLEETEVVELGEEVEEKKVEEDEGKIEEGEEALYGMGYGMPLMEEEEVDTKDMIREMARTEEEREEPGKEGVYTTVEEWLKSADDHNIDEGEHNMTPEAFQKEEGKEAEKEQEEGITLLSMEGEGKEKQDFERVEQKKEGVRENLSLEDEEKSGFPVLTVISTLNVLGLIIKRVL